MIARFFVLALLVTAAVAPLAAQSRLGEGDAPDIAYNATLDQFLVVWSRPINPEQEFVIGRRVDANGTALGPEKMLGPINFLVAYMFEPRAAAVQVGGSKWVAVGVGGGSVGRYPLLIAVDADGGHSETHVVANASGHSESADVGGEATALDDDVILVYDWFEWRSGYRALQAAEVHPDSLTTLQTVDLDTGTSVSQAAISSTGGQPGRYLVTWTRNPGPSADVFGAIIDRNLGVLVPAFPIAQTSDAEQDSDVDGDGTDWIVAYERQTAAGEVDVVCRRVRYDPRSGSAAVEGPVVVEGEPGVLELHPTVAWTGESCQVGYLRRTAAVYGQLVVESLELSTCRPCEGAFPIATTPVTTADIRLAAGRGGDRGLLAWQDLLWVRQSVFVTNDGEVRDLGGGCGQGGVATATCATVGAGAFGLRVRHAAPSASGWLVLGTAAADLPCGPCTLVPVPTAALPATLDAAGNAEVAFALPANPSLRGMSFLAQWLVTAPGGCAPLGWSFSNGLAVTIE